MNQVQIIHGCINKDRKCQQKLYAQYAGWAATICRRYVYDKEKAQEAMQDGFLRVLNNIEQFDMEKGSLKQWMARIFINCSLKITKKEAFNNSFSSLDDMDRDPMDPNEFYSMDAEGILIFLKGMPTGYKTVFNMAVIDGYSHKEIANTLNISEITSRSQLFKAKKWLKKNVDVKEIQSRM